ncbi:Gamma-soluble NSF attachment protein [Smittium mucronatum]|uniref:Gamma-soluble NSF attachment protein n=1 Tax=Smittium mucronatum TaxID=133383 RepID=A0A1R0H6F3_9FUNG|nr:Gamma-soluble NSF attachment protein [Smittium mucronatum]
MYEDTDIETSIQLHLNAITIYETENRGRFGLEEFRNLSSLLVKNKRYDKAVEVLMRLAAQCIKLNNRLELCKTYLCVVICLLAKGDDVEASKQLDTFSQDSYFERSPEFASANNIILAYKEFDQEKLDQAIRDPAINDLNSNFRKLAYTLSVPGFSRNVLGVKSNDYRESVHNKLDSTSADASDAHRVESREAGLFSNTVEDGEDDDGLL